MDYSESNFTSKETSNCQQVVSPIREVDEKPSFETLGEAVPNEAPASNDTEFTLKPVNLVTPPSQ